MKKRFWATILAQCMVLSLLPTNVWAAEPEAEPMPTDVPNEEHATFEESAEPVGLADAPTSGTCGKNVTWSLSSGTLAIAGSGPMSDYHYYAPPWYNQRGFITSVVIGDGVTSIGYRAFEYCRSLTNIMLPDSVTSIGEEAFVYCGLTSIAIPDSVTSIGNSAFSCCSGLTSITLPDSVTSIGEGTFAYCGLTSIAIPDSVTSIGGYVFKDCGELVNVTIPDSVTVIKKYAFYRCWKLTRITIPDSLIGIGDYAFYSCHRLTDITIPDGVTSIGNGAFGGCGGLTSIAIPDGVTSIGNSAFEYCGLTNITLPDSVTSIGNSAFKHCSRLTSITLPDSVTSIGDWAFEYCSSLTSITLPDSITSIGNSAFKHCSRLTSITLPDSITRIGYSAFGDCSNLTNVYYGGSELQWQAITIGKDNGYLTSATIHYNSTGPDDPGGDIPSIDIPDGSVRFFSKWDKDNSKVFFDNDIGGYTINQQTTLPASGLEGLVGKYVLADVDYATVRSIHPVDSNLGTVSAITKSSVTIEGKSYPLATNVMFPDFYIGHRALCHLMSGNVVSLQPVTEKTGELQGWNGTTKELTIGGTTYLTNYLTDFSFLGHIDELLGWNVTYYSLNDIVIGIELSTSEQRKIAGKLLRYDASGNVVFLTDGSSYLVADGTVLDVSGLSNCWISCTIKYIPGIGSRLTKIERINPTLSVELVLDEDNRAINFKDNKLKFQGTGDDAYQSKANFKIPVIVRITNATTIDGVEQSDLLNDESLTATINNLTVTEPDGFNFGWFGGGSVEIDSPFSLKVGQSTQVDGYIRAGTGYHPVKDREEYTVTAEVKTSTDTYNASKNFLVINIPAGVETAQLAADELRKIDLSKIVLAPDVISTLGLKDEALEEFKATLLTLVVLSNTPEKTLREKIDQKLLAKVFGYKEIIGATTYELPLNCILETSKYGKVVMEITCNIHDFELNGSQYGLTADLEYRILKSDRPLPYMTGPTLGGITYSDLSAFANAAYDIGISEAKSAFDLGIGNPIQRIGEAIFGKTVTKIMKVFKTSYKDIAWKITLASLKTVKNSCPTNVFVYNSSNELCGSIENNIVTKSSDDFELSVEGDTKYIIGLSDDYHVKYIATGNGVMDVEITEYTDLETPIKLVSFYDIPLVTKEEYTQNISQTMLPNMEEYALYSNDGKEIQADKEQMLITLTPADGDARVVIFDPNGGTVTPTTATTDTDGKLSTLPTPTRTGYTFNGWYTAADDSEKVDESRIYTRNTTLYAHWTASSGQPGDLNGDGKVTMADVIRLARGAAGYVTLTEQEQQAGDVTGDGKITMADVIRVARYAAGYSTTL